MFDHYDDTLDQMREWEYDLVGNRTLQKLDKGNDSIWEAFTTYNYDVNDRLITEIFDDLTSANKDRITEYGYDHTQQTNKSVSENGTKLNETTFEYDAQGRMAIVTIVMFAEDGTKTRIERISYGYNTDGIRVSALHEIDSDADGVFETSKLTEYLNDPLNITGYSQVLKQTETNLVTGEQANIIYIIGRNRIAQITVKDNTEQELYFTFDGHGSTRVLTNLAGAIVDLYAFDAYGNAIGFDPSVALTEFLYSGEQFDSKIGQQYLRARYYDPAIGRFNRLDPFFGSFNEPQSFHKYLYTHGDPINNTDPSGEIVPVLLALLGMLSIGGIASAWAWGDYKSDGSWYGNAKEYAGMTGLGVTQGIFNTMNGVTDIPIGLLNLGISFANIQIYGYSFGMLPWYIPHIPEWDWSKNLFFDEGASVHGWSKWSGGNGLFLAGSVTLLPRMSISVITDTNKLDKVHYAYKIGNKWFDATRIRGKTFCKIREYNENPLLIKEFWGSDKSKVKTVDGIPILLPKFAQSITHHPYDCWTSVVEAWLRGGGLFIPLAPVGHQDTLANDQDQQ